MSNLSDERMKEIEEIKERVKQRNFDTISELITDLHNDHANIKEENVDLKRLATNLNLEIENLRAEINILKAMGFKGDFGTGSTVHS